MKMIVLAALLAAAGCSKKTSECDAAIGKGMDNFMSAVKTASPNPQMQEMRLNVIGKLKGTLTHRCKEDQWTPEIVSCFASVVAMKDMQTCQTKLGEPQRAKLMTEIREVMMSSMGSRMPAGVPGHPPLLNGGGGPGDPGAAPAGSGAAPAGSGGAPAGSGTSPAGLGAAPSGSGAAASGSGAAPAGSGATAPPAGSRSK